jgi:phage terminase large subunit
MDSPPALDAGPVLYGAAGDLFGRTDPEVVLCGPAGTGKSLACLYKLHLAAWDYPGMRGLIVRKTRESLTQSALVTYEDKVMNAEERLVLASNCQRRVRQSYSYPNGSEVVVGGLDKPTKIMSTEFDMAYVQEAVELAENDWESLSSRLRNGVMPYQQLFGDTNPDAPYHWLKRRIDAGKTAGLESRHEDNPTVTPAYLARLDALTGVRYQRLRLGRWAGAEGIVYDEWDEGVHLIDPFPIPPSWRRIRVVDFGYTNPFVCGWIAFDHDGRAHLYREIYWSQRLVADHAAEIKRLSAGEVYEATVADHDAEDRATLEAAGIRTIAAKKDVLPGIERVQLRLRKAADGRPRLFIHRGCRLQADPRLVAARRPTCTAEEFASYIWAPPVGGAQPKEAPRKADDHGLDMLRYGVMYADAPKEMPATLRTAPNPLAGYRG